jgi:hypothetical protein
MLRGCRLQAREGLRSYYHSDYAKHPACAVPLCGYGEPDELATQDGYTAVERNEVGKSDQCWGLRGASYMAEANRDVAE